MKKILMSAAAAMIFAAGTAQADIAMSDALASWNQHGLAGNQEYTAGIGATHITATSMIRAGGLTASAGANSLNSATWTRGGYVEFGFTVDPGYHANLGSLYFGSKVSATGPINLIIKTSADNFASNFKTIIMNNLVGSYMNNAVDLSSLAAIASQGTFTVRLYGAGASLSAGTLRVGDYLSGSTYYFDTITGTVAPDATPTPIPAAAWLLGSGLLGLVGIRRKQS